MTKKIDETNVAEKVRTELYIKQLKIVALNSRMEALKQRQNAISAELNVLSIRVPETEAELKQMLEVYKPEYENLKKKLEVPTDHELNLETGEFVKNQ